MNILREIRPMTLRKTLSIITTAVAAVCCFAFTNRLVAAAPIITYAASGTFASIPTSGADALKLAGEPFNVSIAHRRSQAEGPCRQVAPIPAPAQAPATWASRH